MLNALIRRIVNPQRLDWGQCLVPVPDEWKASRGRGATVLVVDTGAPAHKELSASVDVPASRDFTYDGDGIADLNGHATAVCGIIAAADNGWGRVGYAPEARIVCFRVADRKGVVGPTALCSALEAAAGLKPDVVNVSLSVPLESGRMRRAVEALCRLGIPVVCSAGNRGEEGARSYPACFSKAIAVGALGRDGKPAKFSCRHCVDCWFPGVSLRTTWVRGGWREVSGTSFAAPCASGLLALMAAARGKPPVLGVDGYATALKAVSARAIRGKKA